MPEVRQRITEYPAIQFHPHETVFVSARGSVRVGKNFWKRYVDPDGSNTDRYYHGLIWIPGARIRYNNQFLVTPVGTSLVRISSVSPGRNGNPSEAEELVIGREEPQPWLRLGYEDNPRDKTTYEYCSSGDEKCENLDNAAVEITITSKDSTPTPSRQLLPFDLVAIRSDENGFFQDPKWFGNFTGSFDSKLEAWKNCNNFPYKHPLWRVEDGVSFECTQQASLDVPLHKFNTCLLEPGFGELHGHVNWAPATYIGKLRYVDFSADGDIDLQLFDFTDKDVVTRFSKFQPTKRIGPILTKDSQGDQDYKDALWLEFANYEVTKYFEADSGDGWQLFRYAESKQNQDTKENELTKKVFAKTAVVTGLLGLDCVHECHTELHPVYALAFRTKREDINSDINADDPWMIFVRNSGNEGDCASDEHFLDRDAFTLFLPAPVGAELAVPTTREDSKFVSERDGLSWRLSKAENGVLVSFSFKPKACRADRPAIPARIHGVLHLNWKNSDTSASGPLMIQRDPEAKRNKKNAKSREGRLRRKGSPPSSGDTATVSLTSDVNETNNTNCNPPTTPEEAVISRSVDFRRLELQAREAQKNGGLGFVSDLKDIKSYFRPNIGIYYENLAYNSFSQSAPVIGGRVDIFQTPLGSIEFEGGPGIPRTVTSSNGQRLTVKISDWMGGTRIQLFRFLGLYLDIKGGMVLRSASSGFESTPDFRHFNGNDGLFYAGGGVQPFRERPHFVPLRITAGAVILPGTGETVFRVTVGSHFTF
jgi:hypothetical protein